MTDKELVAALGWAVIGNHYTIFETGKDLWQLIGKRGNESILARAETEADAWRILADQVEQIDEWEGVEE